VSVSWLAYLRTAMMPALTFVWVFMAASLHRHGREAASKTITTDA